MARSKAKPKKVGHQRSAPTRAELVSAREEARAQIERARRAGNLETHFAALTQVLGSYTLMHMAELQSDQESAQLEAALARSFGEIERIVEDPRLLNRLEAPLRQLVNAVYAATEEPRLATLWWSLHREQHRAATDSLVRARP